MKKLKSRLALAAAFVMVAGLTACQSEDIASQADESAVAMKAVAHITIGDGTRASLTPDASGLKFAWDTSDKVVVISEDGTRNIGTMTLVGEGGQSYGDFVGTLNVRPNDTKVNVYYLGRNKKEGLNTLRTSTNISIADQQSGVENNADYAVMHCKADLSRVDDQIVMEFMVKSIISYGRFCFHLPEGVVASNNEVVTVKGTNIYNGYKLNLADASITDQTEGAISIVPDWSNAEGGDASMTFVPAVNATTDFEVTVNGTTYKAAIETKDYVADMNYCGGEPLHGRDIYFTRDGSWTLNYDANGGTSAPVADTVNDVFTPSHSFTVTDEVPTRNGFPFLGWADDKNATEALYHAGDNITLTRPEGSKTLFAVWGEEEAWHKNAYTLIYGKEDGGEWTRDSQSYDENNQKTPWIFYTGNYQTAYPTKAGYTFLGWADTPNATTVKYAKTGATIDLTKEVFTKTVYPVWKQNGAEGNVTAPGSGRVDY